MNDPFDFDASDSPSPWLALGWDCTVALWHTITSGTGLVLMGLGLAVFYSARASNAFVPEPQRRICRSLKWVCVGLFVFVLAISLWSNWPSEETPWEQQTFENF